MDSQPAMIIRKVTRAELQQIPDAQFEEQLADQNGDVSLAPPWEFDNAEAADYCLARIVARHTHSLRMAALHKAEAEVQAQRAERFIRRYADLFAAVAEGKRNWTGMHSGIKVTCQDRLPKLALTDKALALTNGFARKGEPPIVIDTDAVRAKLAVTPKFFDSGEYGVQQKPVDKLAYTLPGAKDGE